MDSRAVFSVGAEYPGGAAGQRGRAPRRSVAAGRPTRPEDGGVGGGDGGAAGLCGLSDGAGGGRQEPADCGSPAPLQGQDRPGECRTTANGVCIRYAVTVNGSLHR